LTGAPRPLFVVGPPRSGTTIVTQTLNTNEQIKLFDEVSLIDVLEFGASVVGKLRAFLMERGLYEDFRAQAQNDGDPAAALCKVMDAHVAPRAVWGEKNPMYATHLAALRGGFPGAAVLFVLRDPREVVNSYLTHRGSPFRSRMDFWIKDSVSEALALYERCVEPILNHQPNLQVLRYESFIASPNATLDAALSPWGVRFQAEAPPAPHEAPDSVGDHQFFRHGMPLPWKLGNLSPIQSQIDPKSRLDAADPAWSRVEVLADRLGYR
jgi:hypothetical protein